MVCVPRTLGSMESCSLSKNDAVFFKLSCKLERASQLQHHLDSVSTSKLLNLFVDKLKAMSLCRGLSCSFVIYISAAAHSSASKNIVS